MTQQARDEIDAMRMLEEMTESVLVTTTELDRPGPLIVYVNPAFERMTGWSRQDVLGKSPRILQGPRTEKKIFEDMRERLNRGEPWQGQAINYRRDGSEFVMEWSIVPIRDEQGRLHRYLAVQRDVTERVVMEEKLAAARVEERKWFQRLEETNRELSQVNTVQQETLSLFVKYVPESVVRKGLETRRETLLHGEQLEIVALFCDMRGFTALSERLTPDMIVGMLNTYYTMMADVISAHDGVINQFVGDEIFVGFGVPLPVRDCVASGVRCAVAMVERLEAINEKLREPIGREISVGIGMEYGTVVAGNLGSEDRLSYSITGDTVNTAKRIESLAKTGRNTVLLGEALHERARHLVSAKPWPPTPVKGKGKPVRVYEVLGLREIDDRDRSERT
jgi:PAS domain S-box-containing protein